jgi:hypothetical protein
MKPAYKKYGKLSLATVFSLTVIAALAFGINSGKSETNNSTDSYLTDNAISATGITGTINEVNRTNTVLDDNQSAKTGNATTASGHTDTVTQYPSVQQEGIIGNHAGKLTDNPADNIFTVSIDKAFSSGDKVWLTYELSGVTDFTAVPHSINDRLAKGGYLVKQSDESTLQREQLNPAWLKQGENRITFSLPENAGFGYSVKHLSIEVEKGANSTNSTDNASNTPLLAVNTSKTSYGNKSYIYGFVQGTKENATIHIAGKEIPTQDGEFEAIVDLPAGRNIEITATPANNTKLSKELFYKEDSQTDAVFAFNNNTKQTGKTFTKGISNEIALETASLKVDSAGLLAATKNITLTTLRSIDLPALDMDMTNVTAEREGYRFLPHGEHFAEGATVAIGYDRTRIPSGFTEDDVKTFYFDLNSKHWVALERDTIDKAGQLIVSRTTHFTDMINGVIQTPESPETQGFAPTMMNGIKAADPTAKVQLIAPPTANSRGSAGLSYTFEMPPARNGMQPSLGIQYNSDGGSGLLGEGWDLNIQSITVDTRWGVPRYNSEKETETYLMSGSMLLMMDENGKSAVAHRGDKINRTADRQFYPRNEGGFARIIRKGDNPGN